MVYTLITELLKSDNLLEILRIRVQENYSSQRCNYWLKVPAVININGKKIKNKLDTVSLDKIKPPGIIELTLSLILGTLSVKDSFSKLKFSVIQEVYNKIHSLSCIKPSRLPSFSKLLIFFWWFTFRTYSWRKHRWFWY